VIGDPVRDEGGFTLVEAMLSIVILAVALVPLMNLFAHGAERNKLVPEVVAAGLATAKMEELLANRALQGWGAFSASPTSYQAVDTTSFPGYQWKVEVVKVAQNDFNQALGVGANTRFKRITVFVQKPGGQELKLMTVVTDY
jgi:Tfp pilus assembly protein PilV